MAVSLKTTPSLPQLKKHNAEALSRHLSVKTLVSTKRFTPMAATTTATLGLSDTFSKLKKQGKVALIPYITAGDPDLSTTAEALKVLSSCNSDIIELGVPYSDPLADGPVIQSAATRSSARGTNFDDILLMLEEAGLVPTAQCHGICLPANEKMEAPMLKVLPQLSHPIALFTYYNPILKHGVEKFIYTVKDIGIPALCVGFRVSVLVICGWWLYKFLKKGKKIKLKKKFLKRNGGLLLDQKIISRKGSIQKAVLFNLKELDKATDCFDKNRILGQGGQGAVYLGMLADGRIVAVKKSMVVNADKVEEFINEVDILSQINHRNVVKLLGCCLETEVPLLVYEFISNGTLSRHLHDKNEEFQLSWEMLLRIAIEVAEALSYLHSSASPLIYHRDIKSNNILLDDKYRAKVADFGISRSLAIEQTHLTTNVRGTVGYLDPEYVQSRQFTEKSDVYSFGVVLVEIITGKKPSSIVRATEERSLATHFILLMEENRLFEIVDARNMQDSVHEEIIATAKLACRCLSLSGKNRPTMKEVVVELGQIPLLQNASNVQQI